VRYIIILIINIIKNRIDIEILNNTATGSIFRMTLFRMTLLRARQAKDKIIDNNTSSTPAGLEKIN
jgi:hypothetical protein